MLTLRPYRSTDASTLLDLFRCTIREINAADYDPLQIDAWASDSMDVHDWHQRFVGRFAYVALIGDRVVGFSDMRTDGYLDRLFVSAQYQRQGIATVLLEKLVSDARTAGIAEISTDASITAKPFFEAAGFATLRQQSALCRGVELVNYRMVLGIE